MTESVDVTIPEILTKPRFGIQFCLAGNLAEQAELHKPKKRMKKTEISFAKPAADYPKHENKKTPHITPW